jgi:glucose/arabinose dehydrogenase
MALLADGTLLLTTGDGFDYREQAQNTNSNLGKTIRINRDGSLPSDNPFTAGGGHPAVWTYGHRNPQGLAVDPANGAIYLHEHGPRGGDEINVLQPGSNYGWPAATFGLDYSGAKVSPFTQLPDMQAPLKVWVPSIAPSGLAVYRGEQFPEWQGSLFVGALVDQEVRRVSFDDDGLHEEAVFPEISARIRDIRTTPDGALLIVTDGSPGAVYRISQSAE